jgi:hypothetical protein
MRALRLEMGDHLLISHLSRALAAFLNGAAFHLSLVKIVFEDPVQRAFVNVLPAERTVLVALSPVLKAAVAKDSVALSALDGVEDKVQTYAALELVLNLLCAVGFFLHHLLNDLQFWSKGPTIQSSILEVRWLYHFI